MNEINYEQTGYVVKAEDSVGTALGEIHRGLIHMRGKGAEGLPDICAAEDIPFGHKFAVRDIAAGAPVIKYGVIIATAVKDIRVGEHVHLHNVRSNFDMRAATYDQETADSTDMEYEVY